MRMVDIGTLRINNILVIYLEGNVMYKGRYIGMTEIGEEEGILLIVSEKSRLHIWVPLNSIIKVHNIGPR